MNCPGSRIQQRGIVLLVSLLVLMVLAVIAATVARTSQLQLRMAGNEEARIAAQQRALAAIDGVLPIAVESAAMASVGYRWCTPDFADEDCNERTIAIGADIVPVSGNLDVALVRVAPELGRLPVLAETRVSSTVHYRVARMEVQATYEGMEQAAGRSVLAQGVLVRLPESLQTGEGSL